MQSFIRSALIQADFIGYTLQRIALLSVFLNKFYDNTTLVSPSRRLAQPNRLALSSIAAGKDRSGIWLNFD
jgi:hypothetical protein